MFFHVLSFSLMFSHVRSFSFIFVHFRSFSFIFVHFRSFSFIFVHFRSFSFIFVHFLSFSLCLLCAQNLFFFLGLNFGTISLEQFFVKNQFFGPISGGTPLGPLFFFFSHFVFLPFFVFFSCF